MNERSAVAAFAALANEHRLRLMRMILRATPEGIPAGSLAEGIGAPQSSVSFHLAALERAGLVTSRRESRSIIYSADPSALAALVGFLLDDCCGGRPDLCAVVLDGAANRPSCCVPAAS
jgi:ArsR family transcriptional regulator